MHETRLSIAGIRASLSRKQSLIFAAHLSNDSQSHLVHEFVLAAHDELSTSRPLHIECSNFPAGFNTSNMSHPLSQAVCTPHVLSSTQRVGCNIPVRPS